MHKLLNKLLGIAEEINGCGRCPTYLYRWVLLSTRFGKLYIHKFVGDDWTKDLHDHPKDFMSIGIYGAYVEETVKGLEIFVAPWFRRFHAEHKHRIITPWGHCWTIVWVSPLKREWGFWHGGKWLQWKQYVEERGGAADKMKACE